MAWALQICRRELVEFGWRNQMETHLKRAELPDIFLHLVVRQFRARNVQFTGHYPEREHMPLFRHSRRQRARNRNRDRLRLRFAKRQIILKAECHIKVLFSYQAEQQEMLPEAPAR